MQSEMPPIAPKRARFSLSCVAVLLAVGMIAVCAAVVLAVTLTGALAAADDFATRFTRATAQTGTDKVRELLQVAVLRHRGLAHATEHRLLPDFSNDTGAAYDDKTHQYTQALRHAVYETDFRLLYIGIGFIDATFLACGAISRADETYLCLLLSNKNGNATTGEAMFSVDVYARGVIVGGQWFMRTYTPQGRQWYQDAPKTYGAGAFFSTVYIDNDYDVPVVDLTSPVFTPARTLMGVTSITLDLTYLSTFLAGLAATPKTLTAITDNDGMLLGASTRTPLWEEKLLDPTSGHPLRPGCVAVARPRIQLCRFTPAIFNASGALNALAHRFPHVLAGGTTDAQRLDLGAAGPHYVSVTRIDATDAGNMRWRLASLVPEDDVVGAIIGARDLALGLTAVVVVVGGAVCAGALYVLLRPLAVVAARMEGAATFRDSELAAVTSALGGGGGSRLREVAAIEQAFGRLCGQLARAKSFLPATLIAQLEASDDGEDFDDEDFAAQGFGSEATCQLSPAHSVASESCHASATSRQSSSRTAQHSAALGARDSSTVASSRSGTTASSRVAGPLHALDAALPLSRRAVSVVAANSVGFHAVVAGDEQRVLGRAYGALVDAVRAVAAEHRGVLDAFHGDRFFATFNAVKPLGSHAAMATRAALVLSAGTATACPLAAGVAMGPAVVGNMGSRAQRRFCTVGPVYAQAATLERLGRRYPNNATGVSAGRPTVLLSSGAAADAAATVELLDVDLVTLPGAKGPAAVSVALAVREGSTDEWMYALHAANTRSPFSAVNAAFRVALAGSMTEARALLSAAPHPSSSAAGHAGAHVAAVRALVLQWIEAGAATPTALGPYYDLMAPQKGV